MFNREKIFTPESFEKKSENILSIFTSTISDLKIENEKAVIQTEINDSIIQEKRIANTRIENTIESNSTFITKLTDLFN